MRRFSNLIKYIAVIFPLYFIFFSLHWIFTHIELYEDYYYWSDASLTILVIPSVGLVLFALFLVFRRNVQLAGLCTLIALIAVAPTAARAAPLYVLGALFGVALVLIRIPRHGVKQALELPRAYTVIFNVVAGVALATVLGHVVSNTVSARQKADSLVPPPLVAETRTVDAITPDQRPHIIHILLDGYSRADVLKELYGYDNTPFLEALRERGFRVSDRATAPYNQTLLVMASIFTMNRITDVAAERGVEHGDRALRSALRFAIRESAVTQILEQLGYELRSTPVSYPPVEWDSASESVGTNGWARDRLGPMLFLQDILNRSPILTRPTALLGSYSTQAAIDYELLTRVSERRFHPSDDRPLFVYQHIIAPHPPFNIRADGSPMEVPGFPPTIHDGSHLIRNNDANRIMYRDAYIEKLRFINNAMIQQIDGLMETLPEPRIIILHGDHGGGLYLHHDRAEQTCFRERFSTLFAIHASDTGLLRNFQDDFNVLNLYRVIFRSLLPLDLPDLPHRHVFIPWNLENPIELDADMLERRCEPLPGNGALTHSN